MKHKKLVKKKRKTHFVLESMPVSFCVYASTDLIYSSFLRKPPLFNTCIPEGFSETAHFMHLSSHVSWSQ